MEISGLDSELGQSLAQQLIVFHVQQKAKQLESEIYNAIHRIGRDAEIAAAHAERKAVDLGLKAVEAGAEIADKVADEADKVAGKAKDKWGK